MEDDNGENNKKKRARYDTGLEFERVDSGYNSPEAKRIREDLLDILDDSDTARAWCTGEGAAVPQPYLLEASDDEMGLPPAISPADEHTENDSMDMRLASPARQFGFDEMMVMEEEIPSVDSFEGRIVEKTREVNEFVTLGGLFDYPESFDFSDFPQPELPAL